MRTGLPSPPASPGTDKCPLPCCLDTRIRANSVPRWRLQLPGIQERGDQPPAAWQPHLLRTAHVREVGGPCVPSDGCPAAPPSSKVISKPAELGGSQGPVSCCPCRASPQACRVLAKDRSRAGRTLEYLGAQSGPQSEQGACCFSLPHGQSASPASPHRDSLSGLAACGGWKEGSALGRVSSGSAALRTQP